MNDLLAHGKMEVLGRLVDASNATLLGEVFLNGHRKKVIYKPIAGERPLWDFPNGNLANREIAAYLVSDFAKFDLVPRTLLRDGPFGLGSVQEWIEVDENIDVIVVGQSEQPEIRSMALFDAVINNTDRKFGHILVDGKSRIFGCDHGVTFHVENKLRTVLWQFAGLAFLPKELEQLTILHSGLISKNLDLRDLLSMDEVGALIARVESLLKEGSFPLPSEEWPAVPWPPV